VACRFAVVMNCASESTRTGAQNTLSNGQGTQMQPRQTEDPCAVRAQREAWRVRRVRRAARRAAEAQGGLGRPALARRRALTWLNPQVPSLVSLLNSWAPVRQTDLSGAPDAA
jgi:hypothetical protein